MPTFHMIRREAVSVDAAVSHDMSHFLKRPFSHQYLTFIDPAATVLLR